MDLDRWGVSAPETGFRVVPHIGVIAESLPSELTEWNGGFSGGYFLGDMDGLLVAAVKGLDRQLQECRADNRALAERLKRVEGILEAMGFGR